MTSKINFNWQKVIFTGHIRKTFFLSE